MRLANTGNAATAEFSLVNPRRFGSTNVYPGR